MKECKLFKVAPSESFKWIDPNDVFVRLIGQKRLTFRKIIRTMRMSKQPVVSDLLSSVQPIWAPRIKRINQEMLPKKKGC